jgi:hypothetical protein
MKHGSTSTGASNNSFVSGPMKKVGNTAFVFDVGSGSTYRPLTITAPSNTTDAFTAEYFNTGQTLGSSKDTTITFVSDCSYWKLDRNAGSSNITPKFAFDSLHCDYLTVKPVHIALWNGTKWTDKGEAVTESNNKTTSSAMTSYGYFAFAYNLVPGDAPQMPYPLTAGSTCNSVELQFTSNDIWFSFTPDSSLIKIKLTSPENEHNYAAIKQASIFEEYLSGHFLDTISTKLWQIDSLLFGSITYVDSLIPNSNYLFKVTRFTSSDGPGIYDTTDYFLNICLINIRNSLLNQLIPYTDTDFITKLQSATPGDILYPTPTSNYIIDLTGTPGLDVEEEVTLVGNYDLLSEPFSITAGGTTIQIVTSPTGTLFTSLNRGPSDQIPSGTSPHMFVMAPQSAIRNIRLKGAMPGYQDYNKDRLLCVGIKIDKGPSQNTGPFEISHCEISDFSHSAIYVRANSDDIRLNNCNIHHIKGGGGTTTAKGYGVWIQGATSGAATNTLDPIVFSIDNSIFDECKEALDLQPNPANLIVDSCSFGQFFSNENINRHSYGSSICTNCIYNHPDPNLPNCEYFADHDDGCIGEVTDVAFDLGGPAAGATTITKSIFHQSANNISLPYPANSKALPTVPASGVGIPLYNIKVNDNTFATPNTFPSDFDCAYGGFLRINDNHINVCVWDYERTHNVLHQILSGPNSDPNPIFTHEPNSFSYVPGISVSANSSPQPPEANVTFDAIKQAPGFSPVDNPIPVYDQGASIEMEMSHGSVGTQSTNVVYVVQAKLSEGGLVGQNNSGNNAYNSNQLVSEPQTSSQNFTNTDLGWDTNKPGLFGIDVTAVDGNFSGSACSPYYASKMNHQPVIIAPNNDYLLIFNVKDSYYADLYQNTSINRGVTKQVELNGHIIWLEDISKGGDNWERVELDLVNGYCPDGITLIKTYLNQDGFKNVITFSIGIANPGSVIPDTSGLVGLLVWVDDIYLKKYQSPDNLIIDGDVEGSLASELTDNTSRDCIWYVKNKITFEAYHLSKPGDDSIPEDSALYTSTEANLTSIERKSGNRAIQLVLPPLKTQGLQGVAASYGEISGTAGSSNEFISVAVDFDIRDFYSCTDVAGLLGYIDAPSTFTSSVSDEKLVVENSMTISTNNLVIENSDLLFATVTPPITITIPDGITFTIKGIATDPTYLGGCKNMWGGFIIEPNGHLIVTGTGTPSGQFVTIEDAYIAVSAIGDGTTTANEPKVELSHVRFNKNQTSCSFENDDFSNSFIKGCMFNCEGGYISKDPVVPYIYSDAHVLLEDVTGAPNIAHLGSILSEFYDAYIGIKAIRSDVKSANCKFVNLMNHGDPLLKGIGIVAENSDPDIRIIDVTSRFINLKKGVSTLGNFNIDISYSKYYTDIEAVAIDINSQNYNNDISISGIEKFERCNMGINILSSNLGSVSISDNTFINTGFVENIVTPFHNTAISIQRPFLTARQDLDVAINGNAITDFRIGIHAANINGIELGTTASNQINYNLGPAPSVVEYHAGVWLKNCNGAFIKGSGTADIENDEEVTNTNIDFFRGIDIEDSYNCRINCNHIKNIPRSIYFTGNCNLSKMRLNKFENFENGVELFDDQTILPPQGEDPGTGFLPYDNEWINGTMVEFRTFRNNSLVPNPIAWYYDNAINGTLHDPEPSNTVFAFHQNNDCDCDCNTNTRLTDRDRTIGYIINDSLSFSEHPEEFSYQAKMNVFLAMKSDSTLIYQGASNDSIYLNFYNSMLNSNMNRLDSVIILSDQALTEAAHDLNEAIADTNYVEFYLKIVGDIYLNGPAFNMPLSYSDSTTLEEIAYLPYTLAGKAIYAAAAMVGLEVHPQAGSSSRIGSNSVKNSIESIQKPSLMVYPNPSNEKVYFEFKQMDRGKTIYFKIYDSLGREVWHSTISDTIYEVDVRNFMNGLYRFTANDFERVMFTGNFVVSH